MKISLRQLRTIIQEELARVEMSFKNKPEMLDRFAKEVGEEPELLRKFKFIQAQLEKLRSEMKKDPRETELKISSLVANWSSLFQANPNAPKPDEEGPYSPKARAKDDKFYKRLDQYFATGVLSGAGLVEILIGLMKGSEVDLQGGEKILVAGIAALGVLRFYHVISDLIEKAQEKKRFDYVPPPGKNPGKGSFYNIGD